MKRKKNSVFSRGVFYVIRFFVGLFYGKTEIVGAEKIPKSDAVIVANHTQMNGPIVGELFMPENVYIWCAGQMMNIKEVPNYAFSDFWSQKPRWTHPFFRCISYIIAPLAGCLFNNARTIAVYRDKHIIHTFRETVNMLADGKNMLIFPEKDKKHNNILYEFQENFIDVAKLYYKKTGKELTFIPMYIAPKLKKAYIGEGIKFDCNEDIAAQRSKISKYLSDEITKIARELPRHTVIPYRNISKKYYLTNKDINEVPNEKAGC